MRKVVKIKKTINFYNALYFVGGVVDLLGYYLPNGAVVVVKEGTRLRIGGVKGQLDLGWVKLEKTRRRKVQDLPELVETALDGRAVWLRTRETQNWVFVVSKELWERHREEVKRYLLSVGLSRGMGVPLTLGGDPEFEVVDPASGKIIPAKDVPLFAKGDIWGKIGTDGDSHIAELRPDPAYSPEEYAENFLALVERVKEEGILLSVEGDKYPLGGHIHVGSPDEDVVKLLKDEVECFVEVLDDFVGRVLLPTSGRARVSDLGLYELKKHGWEYKTPPASYYADPQLVRIVYKLVRGLVETLLIEGEISYETLDDERVKPEEYLRFLTQEETEYFLGFPERWARGEISPFVPAEERAFALFRFEDSWYYKKQDLFKEILKSIPVKRPIRFVLYGVKENVGRYFALPTAPEEWRLKGEYPKAPFTWGPIPEVRIGVPFDIRHGGQSSLPCPDDFASWVEDYLAQLGLLAAENTAAK